MKSTTPILCAALVLAAAPALAGDDCDVPIARWQSRAAVQQMAASQGWKVQRLKIDDGCYELRATDAQGRQIKAKLDPQTLAVLQIEHRQRKHERSRERKDRVEATQGSGSGAGSSPVFTPGSTPRAQID